MLFLRSLFDKQVPLRVGDKGANITNPCNEEGKGLEKEVYEVMVLSKGEIIAPAEEEIGPNTEL
jgi:hypothetical protein